LKRKCRRVAQDSGCDVPAFAEVVVGAVPTTPNAGIANMEIVEEQ
jgi:hypothetical protein